MHSGLWASVAALTVLATTVSVAAFQTGSQPNPSASPTAGLQQTDPPQWPYPHDPPKGSPPHPPDDDLPHHVPGSTQTFSMKQVEGTTAVDWFPKTHAKAPTAVTAGVTGGYRACGICHLVNGYGKPDMQSLNGLPIAYMKQQIEDMKNDLRDTAAVDIGVAVMLPVAKAVSEADEEEALEYFHSIGPAKWIRVVETETVPKTTIARHSLLVSDPSGATEPIGNRIVEMPESYDRTLLRDTTSGFVAYAPLGSLGKGEALVRTGASPGTMPCITCHGTDLHGMGDTIPPIAGRSPSAMARQLYGFKTGARHGKNAAMMKLPVEKLTDEDIVDIAAYLASLPQ